MIKRRNALSSWLALSIVALTLLAFGLRLLLWTQVPPGWRDDELIEMYTLSGEVLDGHYPLYFTGASGHEPLFHYLRAGLIALAGHNIVGGHLLSAACGTLLIPLTYVLARRLFGSTVAVLASLTLSCSFWSLMYSRFSLRHIGLPPIALAAFFFLWHPLSCSPGRKRRWALPLGLFLGAGLYIYPAGRLLPAVPVILGLHLALFERQRFRQIRAGYALAVGISLLMAVPLAVAIAQGSSEAAAQGIGADARLSELAVPLRALRQGDPGPLLESIRTTLGMFHATGDPEWLYNIPYRPLFNVLGGTLFWGGVLLCLYRWRQPRYFFLLTWLALGLLPTVLSVPAASLSHSLLVLPLSALLPSLLLVELHRQLASRTPAQARFLRAGAVVRWALPAIAVAFLLTTAWRDLRDYFVAWPREEMVRFLYRADYRQAAGYLDQNPQLVDVAVGSTLLGPWDRVALLQDLQRSDVRLRVFNPRRALLIPAESAPAQPSQRAAAILVTLFPRIDPTLTALLDGPPAWQGEDLQLYRPPRAFPLPDTRPSAPALFADGLQLIGATWPAGEPQPGAQATLWLLWQVDRALDLPPMPLVANPPPPGVYNGPRLAVFTHLLGAQGVFIVGDDGLWVDPQTLQPGDQFLQIHYLSVPAAAPAGPYALEVGLYDPFTGQRWSVLDANGQPLSDYLRLPVAEGGD
jgi:hypothetical protein